MNNKNSNNLEQRSKELYIGLMSGTSIDGLDAALIAIDQDQNFKILQTDSLDWPVQVKSLLNELCVENSESDRVDPMAKAANLVAQHEAQLVKNILAKANLKPSDIVAIGSHGQTIRHRPHSGYSVQIDNGALLSSLTDIDSITNFRAADLANHGEGAPLTQAFHQKVFASDQQYRFVLNLGGIANVTALGKQGELLCAFDTGPANTLMDYVCRDYLGISFDQDGELSRSGVVNQEYLDLLMLHSYINKPYPKSTGREDFNARTISFITERLDNLKAKFTKDSDTYKEEVAKVLATLNAFTAKSVAKGIREIVQREQIENLKDNKDLVLCGGGAFNKYLVEQIAFYTQDLNLNILSCEDFGVDAKFLEAQAFAFFAYCNKHAISLDLCSSTHADRPSILGSLSPAINGHYARMITSLYK